MNKPIIIGISLFCLTLLIGSVNAIEIPTQIWYDDFTRSQFESWSCPTICAYQIVPTPCSEGCTGGYILYGDSGDTSTIIRNVEENITFFNYYFRIWNVGGSGSMNITFYDDLNNTIDVYIINFNEELSIYLNGLEYNYSIGNYGAFWIKYKFSLVNESGTIMFKVESNKDDFNNNYFFPYGMDLGTVMIPLPNGFNFGNLKNISHTIVPFDSYYKYIDYSRLDSITYKDFLEVFPITINQNLIDNAEICLFYHNNSIATWYTSYGFPFTGCLQTAINQHGVFYLPMNEYYYYTVSRNGYQPNTSIIFNFNQYRNETPILRNTTGNNWSVVLSTNNNQINGNMFSIIKVLVNGSSDFPYFISYTKNVQNSSFGNSLVSTNNPTFINDTFPYCGQWDIYTIVTNGNYEERESNHLIITVRNPCDSTFQGSSGTNGTNPNTPLGGITGNFSWAFSTTFLCVAGLVALGIWAEIKIKSAKGLVLLSILIIGLFILSTIKVNNIPIIPIWIPIVFGIVSAFLGAMWIRKGIGG